MSTMKLPEPQAASLRNSWKYLAHDRLPRMDTATAEVYSQLNRSGCSGFILSAKGDVQGYTKPMSSPKNKCSKPMAMRKLYGGIATDLSARLSLSSLCRW
jgi:hypothetical protein